MANEKRIRALVDSNEEDVTLNDIISKLIEISPDLRNLEFSSVKADLSRAKQGVKEAKDLIIAFEKRIKGEVTDDVFAVAKVKNKNYKGNAHTLNT